MSASPLLSCTLLCLGCLLTSGCGKSDSSSNSPSRSGSSTAVVDGKQPRRVVSDASSTISFSEEAKQAFVEKLEQAAAGVQDFPAMNLRPDNTYIEQ
ncbi:MAG: hypothetical protein AAF589_07050 [Planctomycetota bacterium]